MAILKAKEIPRECKIPTTQSEMINNIKGYLKTTDDNAEKLDKNAIAEKKEIISQQILEFVQDKFKPGRPFIEFVIKVIEDTAKWNTHIEDTIKIAYQAKWYDLIVSPPHTGMTIAKRKEKHMLYENWKYEPLKSDQPKVLEPKITIEAEDYAYNDDTHNSIWDTLDVGQIAMKISRKRYVFEEWNPDAVRNFFEEDLWN